MSTENGLTILGQEDTSLALPGGLGVDFGSKLFQLKPATLGVVQSNTTIDGAIKGKLRVSETGDQFDFLTCTLLVMPIEQRSFYTGVAGQLNRTPDNLMCFSRDMVRPDAKAKVPQAVLCKNCAKADWEAWRQNKVKENIPPCDAYYYVVLIDTVYKMPLQMFIRSKAKQELEQGCQNISRRLAMMKAGGKNPNLFDIKFKLSTKSIKTGQFTSYVPVMSDFSAITDEERVEFGDIYTSFLAKGEKASNDAAEEQAQSQVDNAGQSIDDAVVGDIAQGEIIV